MADATCPVGPGATLRHRVTWRTDEPAAHQIRIRLGHDSNTVFLVGCTCGAETVRMLWSATDEEMWATHAALTHRGAA